jgi:hypothetical protein
VETLAGSFGWHYEGCLRARTTVGTNVGAKRSRLFSPEHKSGRPKAKVHDVQEEQRQLAITAPQVSH